MVQITGGITLGGGITLTSGSGGGGGGGGSSTWIVVGANEKTVGSNSEQGAAYVFDASSLSSSPTKLTDSGGAALDKFGERVAAYGDTIVVSAPSVDTDSTDIDTGRVFVYDGSNLSSAPTELGPSGLSNGDKFGSALAVSNSHIVVGAPFRDVDGQANEGQVFVYDRSNVSATPTTLTLSDLTGGDQFGYGLAASDDYIVVTAPFKHFNSNDDMGAAYVFDATDLSASATKILALYPSGRIANARFGWTGAAIAGDHIIIPQSRENSNQGAVYVYDGTSLNSDPTRLTDPNGASGDQFGSSVAADGTTLVVGAYLDDAGGTNTGSIFVYDLDNLSTAPTVLTVSGNSSNEYLGYSVSIQNGYIVAGAWNDGTGGSAWVWDASDLSAAPTEITASDAASGDRFGWSVAVG